MPYFLKLTVNGKDVTSNYKPKTLIEAAIRSRFFPVEGYPPLFPIPAASAVKNALAVAHDSRELMTVNSTSRAAGRLSGQAWGKWRRAGPS